MARIGAPAYLLAMPPYVVPLIDRDLPDDAPDGLVVWAGVTGPQIGSVSSYLASPPPPATAFSAIDWSTAINAAYRRAEKLGIAYVYVRPNAQGS
jgi:hypothetical protein